MGSEENFQIMQTLQRKNLIVPLVGDFAGPKALRAIGQYLKDHGATVSVVYTSNVEQYLFQDPDNWKEYYSNVGTLPLDSSSTFIRSAFNMGGYYGGGGMSRSQQMLCSIAELLKAFTDGKISHYYDVINMSTAYSP
jgi:hypothetical protein